MAPSFGLSIWPTQVWKPFALPLTVAQASPCPPGPWPPESGLPLLDLCFPCFLSLPGVRVLAARDRKPAREAALEEDLLNETLTPLRRRFLMTFRWRCGRLADGDPTGGVWSSNLGRQAVTAGDGRDETVLGLAAASREEPPRLKPSLGK